MNRDVDKKVKGLLKVSPFDTGHRQHGQFALGVGGFRKSLSRTL